MLFFGLKIVVLVLVGLVWARILPPAALYLLPVFYAVLAIYAVATRSYNVLVYVLVTVGVVALVWYIPGPAHDFVAKLMTR